MWPNLGNEKSTINCSCWTSITTKTDLCFQGKLWCDRPFPSQDLRVPLDPPQVSLNHWDPLVPCHPVLPLSDPHPLDQWGPLVPWCPPWVYQFPTPRGVLPLPPRYCLSAPPDRTMALRGVPSCCGPTTSRCAFHVGSYTTTTSASYLISVLAGSTGTCDTTSSFPSLTTQCKDEVEKLCW